MLGCVRAHDTVSRIGGDEFAMVLSNLENQSEIDPIVARTLVAISRPHALAPGIEVAVTASIGIAVYPDDAADGATLLRSADKAMYRAKSTGRHKVVRFRDAFAQGSHEANS